MIARFLIAVVFVFSGGAAVQAAPPAHLPLIISGDVVTGVSATTMPTTQPTSVFQYSAVWDEALGGYVFSAPGRPVGWDLIVVDGSGGASIGAAVADWSYTPIGRPLEEAGYSFVPQTMDFGVGWDVQATGEPLFWGMVGGLLWDMMVFIYAGTIGRMGRVFGDFHR